MTYATERVRVGREPLTVVDLVLDSCSLTYGSAPCTASGGAGSECYNTRATCQDVANYTKTTTTYRFCERRFRPSPASPMIPALVSWQTAPSKITPGKGLGHRASVSVVLQDFARHDRGLDPYVANRASEAGGTYFGRLLARNKHYQSRLLKVHVGYVAESGIDLASDFETRVYVIDRIDGPDANGRVRITAKDMLKLLDDKRAQAPQPSQGKLAVAVSAASTTLTLDNATDYATSGAVRISSEIITYSGKSGNDLTGCTRATWGTTAASHAVDDSVQACVVYDGDNAVDVALDLVTNYSEVDTATYITTADWESERDTWLVGKTVQAILSTPTGINKLLGELTTEFGFDLWWDETAQEIKLKALAPTRTARASVPSASIVADSASAKQLSEDRLSQVWVVYGRIDHSKTGDDPENHRYTYVQADLDAEAADTYGEPRVKKIYSRWISNQAVAAAGAGRMLNRFVDMPIEISFRLDAGATLPEVAEEITVTSRALQDVDGSERDFDCQVLAREEVEPGSTWEFTALVSAFTRGRYAFVGPGSLGDYTAESAANQRDYAFICDATTGLMSNGDQPYRII